MIKFEDLEPGQMYFGVYEHVMVYVFKITKKFMRGNQQRISAWSTFWSDDDGKRGQSKNFSKLGWEQLRFPYDMKPLSEMNDKLKRKQIRIIW